MWNLRSAQKINDVYDIAKNLAETAFSPWIEGVKYLGESEGTKRSGREMAKRMFGGDGNGLTDFTIGKKFAEDGKTVTDPGITLNGAKIATGAASLGIGYRALSGGGLYRDKDGNMDIAGIPFV